eukprot:m51a1_g4976 hypothetical protein (450) ;mRNA; f:25145-26556
MSSSGQLHRRSSGASPRKLQPLDHPRAPPPAAPPADFPAVEALLELRRAVHSQQQQQRQQAGGQRCVVGTAPAAAQQADVQRVVEGLAARLAESEKVIREKNARISVLEAKLREAEGADTRLRELAASHEALERQVAEMEQFLRDYGLVWVGPEDQGQQRPASSGEQPAAEAPPRRKLSAPSAVGGEAEVPEGFAVDGRLLRHNIRELNVQTGEGVAAVTARADGTHQLRVPDPLPLAVYRDGIFLQGGPFRSFAQASARQLVADIADGYFPDELQRRFPRGVPIRFTDRTAETYAPGTPAALVHATPRGAPQQQQPAGPGAALRRFERALATRVVRNGQLVDVREGLVSRVLRRPQPPQAPAERGEGPLAVKLRLPSGAGVVVRLGERASVGELREAAARAAGADVRLVLAGAPPRRLEDPAAPAAPLHMATLYAEPAAPAGAPERGR